MSRVQIPSLAPFLFPRPVVPDRDKPRHLQAIFHFSPLHPLRQAAPRFAPRGTGFKPDTTRTNLARTGVTGWRVTWPRPNLQLVPYGWFVIVCAWPLAMPALTKSLFAAAF